MSGLDAAGRRDRIAAAFGFRSVPLGRSKNGQPRALRHPPAGRLITPVSSAETRLRYPGFPNRRRIRKIREKPTDRGILLEICARGDD